MQISAIFWIGMKPLIALLTYSWSLEGMYLSLLRTRCSGVGLMKPGGKAVPPSLAACAEHGRAERSLLCH